MSPGGPRAPDLPKSSHPVTPVLPRTSLTKVATICTCVMRRVPIHGAHGRQLQRQVVQLRLASSVVHFRLDAHELHLRTSAQTAATGRRAAVQRLRATAAACERCAALLTRHGRGMGPQALGPVGLHPRHGARRNHGSEARNRCSSMLRARGGVLDKRARFTEKSKGTI